MSIQIILRKACLTGLSFIFFISCSKQPTNKNQGFDGLRKVYAKQLDSTIYYIDHLLDNKNRSHTATKFLQARNTFKQLEPVLAFSDVNNYSTLNGPNILKIEEEDLTDIKKFDPKSFQVLEETIFGEGPIDYVFLKMQTTFISSRLKLIKSGIYFDRYKPYHFLWLLRNSIIRTATTGITGFDSPMLQRSLEEAQIVYNSLRQYMEFFKEEFEDENLYEQWKKEFEATIKDLNGNFDTFDRYSFIKAHTHKQMQLWNATAKDWNVEFPFEMAIANNAPDLFSPNTFNVDYFTDSNSPQVSDETVALGKQLFYDKNLSGDNSMSCGTCHKPQLAFTDGEAKALGKDNKELQRNTPTLLYAAFQKGFFYDKRTGNLEGQISGVVNNKHEFHTDLMSLEEKAKQNKEYADKFAVVFDNGITEANIRKAIATYVRSLTPFNSKFDKNIRDEETTLSKSEILGFNLFMGKAACATCHFPPLFNGTVPPNYKESEMEALGVPATAKNDTIDTDLGRYDIFHTAERKHFFKTPSVRNVKYTAPYMHNGVYGSLEQVMEFYNVGAGLGMGFELEYQTLPADSLHLTDEEQQAIIAFMKSLSDPMEGEY